MARFGMSTEVLGHEIAALKERLERLEAKVDPKPSQKWRAAVGRIQPNDLTREAARLGSEWRMQENQRS
jgi:hypothetical protein